MQSIQLKTRVNADGILQVQMPPETKDTDLEVTVIFQPLSQQHEQPRYNAWGKPVTRESALAAISRMRQLRREISTDKKSIPEMIRRGAKILIFIFFCLSYSRLIRSHNLFYSQL